MIISHSCTVEYETADSRDRHGIVSQFNVVRTSLIDNTTTPLQVGNGNFAFNVDNTGMQVRPPKLCRSIFMTGELMKMAEFFAFQHSVKLGLAQRFSAKQWVSRGLSGSNN